MLLIQYIQIRWYKDDRNPRGSLLRKEYLHPVELKDPVDDPGDEYVFIQTLNYTQQGKEMVEGNAFYKDISMNGCIPLDKMELPDIEITNENGTYRICWFDNGEGSVRRRGGNKDFGRKGKRLSRYPNKLNETAFILNNGESGIIKWNNRFTSYHGQWYEQYQVYFVNTDKPDKKVFIREYDYEYQQLADLF